MMLVIITGSYRCNAWTLCLTKVNIQLACLTSLGTPSQRQTVFNNVTERNAEPVFIECQATNAQTTDNDWPLTLTLTLALVPQ